EDVHSSHNAHNFNPNPNFDFENTRQYHLQKNYQADVADISRPDVFRPGMMINDSEGIGDGPGVVEGDRWNKLGGTLRNLALERLYASGHGDLYRDYLFKKATQYVPDPQAARSFHRPELVRVVSPDLDMQQLIADLNIVGTRSMTAAEQANAAAGGLPPATIQYISDLLKAAGDDSTLNEVLDQHGTAVVNRLIEDGVFQPQERNALFDEDGKIT